MSTTTFTAGRAPGALPLVGHVGHLLRRPLAFLSSLSAYGDLVEIRLGTQPAYVPCHPELLRHVLTDDRTFDKGGPLFDKLREIAGNGLASCPHRAHRRMRRLLQPSFTRAGVERYSAVMQQEITTLSQSWQPGQVIDAYAVLWRLSLRIVARTLFSAEINDHTVGVIQQSGQTALGGVVRQMLTPRLLQWLPLPVNRRYQQALQNLHDIVERLMADTRQDGPQQGGMLATLTTPRQDGSRDLDDTEIHDQAITMLLAGSETTAAALTWAFYLLAQHPVIEGRLQKEVDTVLGGRPACWSDLPNLPFTGHVLTETLRLYPPGWLLTRATTTTVELAGTHLPPDTTIIVSAPAVQRNAGVYDRPEDFDPDRWIPERCDALPRGAFPAFGAGARHCIGTTYAMTEATLALATIVGRWQAECVPGADIRPALAAIYRPRRLFLRLYPRQLPHPHQE